MTDSNSGKCKTLVCFFSTVQRPNDVRLFHRECKSLVKAGFEVHLVLPCEQSGLKNDVYFHAVKRPRNRFTRMTFTTWSVLYHAIKIKADIYHFHDPELLVGGFIMRWFLHKRVVFDMRESTVRQIMGKPYLPWWSRRFVSFFYSIIEKICLKGLAVVVANDRSFEEHGGSYLVRNFPEPDEKLMAKALDMKERLKSPLLIYVGGVWETRGALIYIELANRLVQRGHKFHMIIIGQYEEDFGRLLKTKINELGLQDVVEITGFLNYPQAMELTSRAAIGLCILKPIPNYTFCLAGKIIEYMMCGTPVLTSDFDHWRPYVEGEKVGKMVAPDNMEEIVNTCEQMLQDPQELAAMGRRGMVAVRSKYNWDLEFRELLRCYNDLLDE